MATITVHLTAADGTRRSIDGTCGESLMRAAVAAGVDAIAADCGGMLSCATCHVYVDAAWAARLPPPSRDEAAMLDMTAAPRREHSRLACQIVLETALDGLTAGLPATQY